MPSSSERGHVGQVLGWAAMASVACMFLAGVLIEQHRQTQKRWTVFLAGDPETGAQLFIKKGCSGCHSVKGADGRSLPDLCARQSAGASLSQLVAAMWDHAPRMWEEGRGAAALDQEEMAHLLAFIYSARYADDAGDAATGRELFEKKNCTRCHRAGPPAACVADEVAWADSVWRHWDRIESDRRPAAALLPRFEGREASDLLTFLKCGSRAEPALEPASPERGWAVFRSAGCIRCHSVRGEGGNGQGPEFGPHGPPAMTAARFTGAMWNHAAESRQKSGDRPALSGRQIVDLGAFLYSLRYFEPAGSPPVGATIFSERGCNQCHGAAAEGTGRGPALRGRGVAFNSVTLATALWQHGPRMYRRVRRLGMAWPMLAESDIGHLVAFLSTAPARTARP